MAEPNQQQQQKPPEPPVERQRGPRVNSTKPVRVDLVNTLRCTRIIHSGLEPSTPISLAPGEIKRNVEIAEYVARELRHNGRGKYAGTELTVYEAGKAPAPASQTSDSIDEDVDDAD